MNNRTLGTAACCLTLTVAVPAQAEPLAQTELPPTVVTAKRSEQLLSQALPHTTVIGREAIERTAAVDLPGLLAGEAGFQFSQSGGLGTASTLFLRGSAARQVLVLVDGVPLTKQDSTGSVSLEHILLDQVERVEIVRGNVSAIYGSGAIGGVIQVFTRQGSATPQAYAQLEAGTYGTARMATGFSGQAGATRYALGVGLLRTDGFSAMNTAQYPNENPDNDGYRNAHYHLQLAHDAAPGQTIGVRAQGSEGQFDSDGGGFGRANDVFQSHSQLATWSLYSDNRVTADWRSQLTLSQGRERSAYDARASAYPYNSQAQTRNQTLNWNHLLYLGGDWSANAGAEWQQQAIDTADSYASTLQRERGVRALFAGVSGALGAHALQLNVRHDEAEGQSADTTGYLGYGWHVTPDWKLIASVSSAFNLPPLGYLYDPFSGNPALKPEHARSNEIGLQWARAGQMLRATAFETCTTDLLQYDFVHSRFGNVADASNRGVELSYSGQVSAAAVRASLTLQDPRDDSSQQRLPRRARTLAALTASAPLGAWTLGGSLHYTDERPDIASQPDLGAYTVLHLTARYALSRQLALTARIDNLLDRTYQTAYGYNQSGRAAYVGLVWQAPK